MGATPLSFSDSRRFPGVRSLQSHFGHTSARHQQYFFRPHQHPDFSDRETMFQRQGCGLDLLDLGVTAVGYFLVYTLGMGDQPRRTVAGDDFLANPQPGRKKWDETLAAVWPAVGHRSADQHSLVVISARFRFMDLVPPRQARQAFAWRSNSRVAHLRCMYRALAAPQLPHLRAVCFYPFELWC